MDLSYHSGNATKSERARAQMLREGVTMKGDRLWTEAENEILRALYPDYKAMRDRLPHRSRVALWAQCRKLGFKQARHRWLAIEVSKLRKLYPSASHAAICAEFPGLTWDAIKMTALYHGFRRNPRKHKRTGFPPVDDVLSRIEEIGWTLKDLDLESRTGKYFQKHSWRRHRTNFNALAKAVKALDGKLEITWMKYA